MAELQAGEQIPELRVTPDKYLTVRYAGASGDFNPIHIDEEFARAVGLPGRILHGLWTMAQVARAQTEAAGGPEHLQAPVGAVPRHGRARAGGRRHRHRARARRRARGDRHGRRAGRASRSSATPRPSSSSRRAALAGGRQPGAYNQLACSPPGRSGSCARWWTATCGRASRWRRASIAADPELDCGPSTVRNELALLEEHGLLAHPHVSAGRVPTDAGHRYVVDRMLASGKARCRRRRDGWSCR